MHLNGGVRECSEPTIVDQQTSATNACVPTHLLVDRNLYLGTLREFHAADCFGIFVGEGFLAEQMFTDCSCLFHNGNLLCRIHRHIHDLDRRFP